MPTTDRDIRFSTGMIVATQTALRDEISKRTRSIKRAEANRAAGGTIQHNVLDEHYRYRAWAQEALDALDVAQKQIAHQIAAQFDR